MSRGRPWHRGDDEPFVPVDLTPMIDIVFLLLIFFMVSSRVLEPFGYQVDLPEAEEAPQQQGPSETPTLVVAPDGAAHLGNRTLAAEISADDLRAAIGDAKQVVIRADREAKHGDVMRWMDRLHGVGVDRATLATAPLEKQGGP